MSNLNEVLLVTLHVEHLEHRKIMAFRSEQRALLAELLYATTLSLHAKAHPQISNDEKMGLYTLCHALDGTKIIHYIRHAEGADLRSQSQFLRGKAMKGVHLPVHAKFQRSEFLPDPLCKDKCSILTGRRC